MLSKLKSVLIGSPLPTYLLAEKRLNKVRALAAFSPDALSSIAYANQEIYLGLVVAGIAAQPDLFTDQGCPAIPAWYERLSTHCYRCVLPPEEMNKENRS